MQNSNKEEKQKCVVIVLHGSKEHIGRYSDFMSQLRRTGVPVIGHDLATHGEHIEGDNHNFSFDEMLNSALEIIDEARNEYPNHKQIIFGHSMGSSIVKYIAYSNLREFDGIILSGTNHQRRLLTNTLLFFNMFGKQDKVTKIGNGLAFGYLSFSSRIHGLGKVWISTDKDNIKYYEADDLCGRDFTNKSVRTMLLFTKKSKKKRMLRKFKNKKIPQLILYGTRDPVGRFGKDINKLLKCHNKRGIDNHYTRAFFGARHEVLFDTSKDKATEEVIKFIENKV